MLPVETRKQWPDRAPNRPHSSGRIPHTCPTHRSLTADLPVYLVDENDRVIGELISLRQIRLRHKDIPHFLEHGVQLVIRAIGVLNQLILLQALNGIVHPHAVEIVGRAALSGGCDHNGHLVFPVLQILEGDGGNLIVVARHSQMIHNQTLHFGVFALKLRLQDGVNRAVVMLVRLYTSTPVPVKVKDAWATSSSEAVTQWAQPSLKVISS